MDKQTTNWEAVLFTILLPLISIGCSLGIHYLETMIGLVYTIVLLLLIVIIVPLAIYWSNSLYSYISNNALEKQMDLEIKEIQNRISSERIMNGICKDEQLALMEKTCSFEEIWALSPDLRKVSDDGLYLNAIRSNLKKGTKYKYFVTDKAENRVRSKRFRKKCGYSPDLEIYYLPDDFFFLVPKVDVSIFEPMKLPIDGKKGYLGLPIEGTDEHFEFLMDDDFVDAIIGKLTEIKEIQ